jgi:hypothetical protein
VYIVLHIVALDINTTNIYWDLKLQFLRLNLHGTVVTYFHSMFMNITQIKEDYWNPRATWMVSSFCS